MAWGAVGGRSAELAEAVGGTARCFYPPGPGRRPPVLVRYLLSAARTGAFLLRARPRVVVVTNPPLVASLVTAALARSVGARVALDSHPGGFGAQGDRVAARLQTLHRWLARRVVVSLVAAPVWQRAVESWGAEAVVVHEAPGPWRGSAPARHRRLRVLYVGRFAADEPYEVVLEAARSLGDCDIEVTGDPAACDPSLRADASGNVRFVGFLGPERYRAALEGADVVVTLTTEPGSVMRAAYEAGYACRPLVVSDWPIARTLFPHAVHVANDAAGLTAALARVDADYDRFAAATAGARSLQLARWDGQRDELVARLLGRRGPRPEDAQGHASSPDR